VPDGATGLRERTYARRGEWMLYGLVHSERAVHLALARARAVVFDLDGTLIDSLSDIATHLNDALVDHGFGACSHARIVEWIGHGAEYLVARAVPSADLVPGVLATFRTRYRARPVIQTRVFDGLPDLLDALPPRKLAVLSNKPHVLTVAIADQLLERWPFGAVHGHDAARPCKPHPDSLRAVARELDVDIAECVLVGDSEVDIETARTAGAVSIGVTWGLRPRDVVIAAAPDYLVHSPSELAALLS
jgi:phosphoglycolate phosphatase